MALGRLSVTVPSINIASSLVAMMLTFHSGVGMRRYRAKPSVAKPLEPSRRAATRSQHAQRSILFPVISFYNLDICYAGIKGTLDSTKDLVFDTESVNFKQQPTFIEPVQQRPGL